MARLAYIQAGDQVGVTHINQVWDEFERKLGILLSGKSPLCALEPGEYDFLGSVFMFSPGTPETRTWFERSGQPAYDHAVFSARAAAAVPQTWDAERQIVWCDYPGDLDGSLEAHAIERDGVTYFIGFGDPAGTFIRPQRRYRFAVAEMVCEASSRLSIRERWNKYNLFRIHNLSRSDDLVVDFGADLTLTVPKMECRTIRRSGVHGTYTQGRYFWRTQAGDPWLLRGGLVSTLDPERSMRACNIANPDILFRWIEALTSPNVRTTFGWVNDPNDLCDLWEDYSDRLADPEKDKSLLGDLAVQKGPVHVVSRPTGQTSRIAAATWQGFGRGVAGCKVVASDDGMVELRSDSADPVDLVCLGTNLSITAGDESNILALPVTLAPQVTLPQLQLPRSVVAQPQNMQWYPGDAASTVTASVGRLASPTYESKPLGQRSTVADLRTALSDRAADLESLVITPAGPLAGWLNRIDCTQDGWSDNLDVSARLVKVGAVVGYRSQVALGTAWPSGHYPDTVGLPGRVDRCLASIPRGFSFHTPLHWEHPYVAGDVINAGGSDFTVTISPKSPGQYKRLGITIPSVPSVWISQNPLNPMWSVPVQTDNLQAYLTHQLDGAWYDTHRAQLRGGYDYSLNGDTYDFHLVPVTAESVNHWAWAVNRLERCRPLSLTDLWWADRETGQLIRLKPNRDGLLWDAVRPTSIRPANQWAKLGSDPVQDRILRALDVEVSTEADLPGDWSRVTDIARGLMGDAGVSLGDYFRTWKLGMRRVYTTPELLHDVPSDTYKLRAHGYDEFTGVEEAEYQFIGVVDWVGSQPGVFQAQEYRWVTVDEVRALADTLGVAFIWSATGRPLDLRIIECSSPSILDWSPRRVDGWVETDWQAGTVFPELTAACTNTAYDVSDYINVPRHVLRFVEAWDFGLVSWIADADWLGFSAPRQDSRLDVDFVCREVGQLINPQVIGGSPTVAWWVDRDPFAAQPWQGPVGAKLTTYFRDGIPDEVRSVDALETRTLCHVSSTNGCGCNSFAVLTPAWDWTREANFTVGSLEQLDRFAAHGDLARRPDFHAPDAGDGAVIDLEPNTVIRPIRRAAFVTIIPELTQDLA